MRAFSSARQGRIIVIATAVLVLLFVGVPAAQAVKIGAPCKKLGQVSKSGRTPVVCTKSGKKKVWRKRPATAKPSPSPAPAPSPTPSPSAGTVSWTWDEGAAAWRSSAQPPACASPIIPNGGLIDFAAGPVSILQPGQTRGGSYKPHGGVRWSAPGTYVPDTTIRVPFDGYVVMAVHYLVSDSAGGTIYQFGVNIVNECGIMLRLGHLHVPSAQFAAILSTLPPAILNDSRENEITPVAVRAGDVIATSVGQPPPAPSESLGTYIDFGLLDLRATNPALPADFTSNAAPKYAKYSVCWYEGSSYLGTADRTAAEALPFANGDGTSDYCTRA